MRKAHILLTIFFLSGCAYPTSGVRVPDDRPSIAVTGAPRNALLFLDGLEMGVARIFDGKNKALLVEPGTHLVEVIDQGKILLREKVYLGGGELKLINVHGTGDNK